MLLSQVIYKKKQKYNFFVTNINLKDKYSNKVPNIKYNL